MSFLILGDEDVALTSLSLFGLASVSLQSSARANTVSPNQLCSLWQMYVNLYKIVKEKSPRPRCEHILSSDAKAAVWASYMGGNLSLVIATKVDRHVPKRAGSCISLLSLFVCDLIAFSVLYSFTWMSSRLDRNIITVITGQAVDAFDRLFRFLYVTSSNIDLRQIATEPEPAPEPLKQPAAVVLPSAALARKLHNPKYALVAATNPPPSAQHSSPKEPVKNPDVPESNKRRQKQVSKEAVQDVPPLHPGLTDLEKACLIEYLPTWPEPDPPSDVIGFINIRDAKKPTQVHLQRSEMFETSQAIRFRSPIHMPKEILPEVAKPRQLTAKSKQMFTPQPAQDDTKVGESVVHGAAQPGDIKCNKEEGQKIPASGTKTESAKDAAVLADTLASQGAANPNTQGPSCNTHMVTMNSPKPESQPEIEVETSLNTQCVELRTESLESNSTISSLDTNTEPHAKELSALTLTNSHREAGHMQTPNIQASTTHSHITTTSTSEMHSQSDSPTSLSENSHILVTTSTTSTVCGPLSSTVSPSTPTIHPSPPVPKPRTIHMVIKHGDTSDGNSLPEINVVRRTKDLESAAPSVVHNEPEITNVEQLPPENMEETLPELHTEVGPQQDTEYTGHPEEAPQQHQGVTFRDTKDEEAVGLYDNKAEIQALFTDAPKAVSGSTQDIIPKQVDPERLPQTIDAETPETIRTDCESVQVPNEQNNNEPQHNTHHPRAKEPQRISPWEMNPQDNGLLEMGNSFNASTHSPVSNCSMSHTADNNKNCPRESATHTDSNANMIKHNTDSNTICQQSPKPRGGSHTPESPLRLHLRDSHVQDLRSPAPTSLLHSLTSDGFLSWTSTPDSRTCTPGPRSFTPTPDVSDGYVSQRDDSNLSSTSEEYYECSDSISNDPGCDNHGTTEDHAIFSNTNATTIPNTITSPTCINNAPLLGTADRNNSSNDMQSLPGPLSIPSSYVFEEKVKIWSKEKTVNEENGREDDEKWRNVAERRTEQVSPRAGSEEAKKSADQLKQRRDLTEMVEKDKVFQAPKRKKGLNKSSSESLVDGELTLGKSSSQGMDPKRLSSGADNMEVERANKEMVEDKAAARSSGVDKRDRAQRSSDGQKV